MYSDHDYEGNGGPCQALVPRYNPDWKHDYPSLSRGGVEFCTSCDARVMFTVTDTYDGYPSAGYSRCHCPEGTSKNWVCMEHMTDYMHPDHAHRVLGPCNAQKSSVLHPVEGHWCSALEDGYDCMHFEDYS